MIRWPIIDREPVQLPILGGYELALWETLIELADLRPQEWTLIGRRSDVAEQHASRRATTIWMSRAWRDTQW